MKNLLKLLLVIMGIFILVSFVQKPKAWDVPEEFKTKVNPIKKTDKVMAEGKTYYNQYCAGCHGLTGKGDGIKAKGKDIVPASIVEEEKRNDPDGSKFYKIKYGRGVGNLHSFRAQLDDENIWAVIHYIKDFAK
jgi:mono/diheme cytochrome c family protein